MTSTGTLLLVVEPFPSWPSPFLPQHFTPPPVVTAQVWLPPAETDWTPLASPNTSTGNVLGVVELFPSWPFELLPQHFAAPPVVSAQVWFAPAEMAWTPLLSPLTSTGKLLFVVELIPSWPAELLPQHFAPPSAVRAQVCSPPAEMETNTGDAASAGCG